MPPLVALGGKFKPSNKKKEATLGEFLQDGTGKRRKGKSDRKKGIINGHHNSNRRGDS